MRSKPPPLRFNRPPHRGLFTLLFSLLYAIAAAPSSEAESLSDVQIKMGSRFEITVVHTDETISRRALTAAWHEIDRIEKTISSWDPNSETSAVNRAAGIEPLEVSDELFRLIQRSIKISTLTEGAFDISFAGAGRLWDFKAEHPVLPDRAALSATLELVDYTSIKLDRVRRTVYLPKPGQKIGFGGIGKGYAANRAMKVLREQGITSAVVSAGGDLVTRGTREDGSPWSIVIVDPLDRDRAFATLRLNNQAVVTSGDYESFVEIDGVRYAHIIDPRTGYPVRDVRSVTIVCPDAELADALATGVFVLGREAGIALVEQLRGIETLVVDADGIVHTSTGLATAADTAQTAHSTHHKTPVQEED